MSSPYDSTWYTANIGRRGTVREALSLCRLSLSMAKMRRRDSRKLAEAVEHLTLCGGAQRHLRLAQVECRKEVRREALEALWHGMVAQIRLSAGASLT